MISWLVKKHEESIAKKSLERLRSGYALPGDTQRVTKHYGDVGDLIDVNRGRGKRRSDR
ncbi:MAG TPA: hypothetical protein VEA63_07425 [Opitutus sp.]|nr:hypothetical protein [Opitutus sp.]